MASKSILLILAIVSLILILKVTGQVEMLHEECDESDPRHRKAFIEDCSKYYYCYENVLEIVPCPTGFIFDSDVGMCRRGDKTSCS